MVVNEYIIYHRTIEEHTDSSMDCRHRKDLCSNYSQTQYWTAGIKCYQLLDILSQDYLYLSQNKSEQRYM